MLNPTNEDGWAVYEREAENISHGNPGALDRWRKKMPLLNPAKWHGVDAPDREWALREWIPARQATYLTGPGSAGKSLLAQQLCTCIALGLPFMGAETHETVALYVTCEDDELELHRRQKTICEALGVPLSSLSGKLHLVSLAGHPDTELATFGHEVERDEFGGTTPGMRTTSQWDALSGTARAIGAGFIALDNVAHLFAGNENVRHEVAQFVSLLNRLAMSVNGAVLFVGHPNKAGDSFSGSTAWENQVRSRLFLETPKDANGSTLDRDERVLSRQKSNYAANGATLAFRWHRMAFVRAEDLPKDQRADLAETLKATADNETFLRCLRIRNDQQRPVSENPASRTYDPRVMAEMAESKRIGLARLQLAMERLFTIEKIERGFVGRIDRKDKFGLREKCAELCADPALTGCADVRRQGAPSALSHTPYTNPTTCWALPSIAGGSKTWASCSVTKESTFR